MKNAAKIIEEALKIIEEALKNHRKS